MLVKTNAGDVELTAEMARPGMVFQWGPMRITIRDPESDGMIIASRRVSPRELPERADTLLGCDPDIAARADCERYGIAPGIDAGAHGFARLRGGGAVDLRLDDVPGMCVHMLGAGRTVYHRGATLVPTDRFVGLDRNHARPSDIGHLCCCAMNRVDQCTLPIGHDGEHEDIATGARWGSEAEVPAPTSPKWTRLVCGDEWIEVGGRYCTVRPVRTGWAWEVASFDGETLYSGERSRSEDAKADAIARATAPAGNDPLPAPGGRAATVDAARAVVGFLAWCFSPQHTCEAPGCNKPAAGVTCSEKCTRSFRAEIQRRDEEHARRQREAALVALVNAVPAGLDPTGWRAAVLAVHEVATIAHDYTAEVFRRHRLAEAVKLQGPPPGMFETAYHALAIDAYARAIAPQGPRPAPFRHKAPGLPVDDGRDE